MKRHPALQDLSRDHHLVLYRCQQIRRGLARGAPGRELEELVEGFVRFYASDMRLHLQEEDTFVVPAAKKHGDARLRAVANDVVREHRDFRRRLSLLGRSGGAQPKVRRLLAELEPLITAHVRREERELFEGVQAAMPEPDLQALWRDSHEFRRTHRSPAACGVRPRPG